MRWTKPSPYYAASDCGAYTVSRSATPDGDRYAAWHLPTKTPLLYTADPKAAARACETHHKAVRPSDS